MTSRDEYLEKLKSNLDEWNAEIGKMEARAREAQADAKAQYEKQIAVLREMHADAQKRFTEMQSATAEAWDAMLAGSEQAWKTWMNAFEDASSKLKPKP